MLSTCLLSDGSEIEVCFAGLDMNAMVCILIRGHGWILKGRTGCIRFATHLRTWRMSSISCLVAQLPVILDKSMPAFFSRPFLSQIFFLNSKPNACGGFLRELYPPDMSLSAFLCVLLCLLSPRTLQQKNISVLMEASRDAVPLLKDLVAMPGNVCPIYVHFVEAGIPLRHTISCITSIDYTHNYC